MPRKDYTKFSNHAEPNTTELENLNEVTEADTVVEKKVEPRHGIVTNCLRLNIRNEPNQNAKILCEVTAMADLVIDEAESTDDFYKVSTSVGIKGFCMKKYVTVLP